MPHQEGRMSRVTCCVVALGLSLTVASPAAGQISPQARALVVQINVFEASSPANPSAGSVPTYGSGIVIGARAPDSIYVATAKHVVEGSVKVDVHFSSDESVRHDGIVLWEHESLDVALLLVVSSSVFVDQVLSSFDRLGRPGNLSNGSEVVPVGCPDGVCWEIPATPDRVLSYSPPLVLEFQSTFVAGGSSGGGLFDEHWEVVGMVLRNDIPRALAMPIVAVLTEIQDPTSGLARTDWDAWELLGPPSVPRSGYGVTLGASVLWGVAQPTIQSFSGTEDLTGGLETRFPSLRITISRRMSSSRSWHVGGLRLAPANVSITAATAGLSAELRSASGRLLARVFGEGAAGRVRSRFDTGGYVVTGPGGDRYVPIWEKQERDGLGFGGGVTVELTAMRNTILELTAGGWSFGMPEDAPDVPYFYVGGGLRLGR